MTSLAKTGHDMGSVNTQPSSSTSAVASSCASPLSHPAFPVDYASQERLCGLLRAVAASGSGDDNSLQQSVYFTQEMKHFRRALRPLLVFLAAHYATKATLTASGNGGSCGGGGSRERKRQKKMKKRIKKRQRQQSLFKDDLGGGGGAYWRVATGLETPDQGDVDTCLDVLYRITAAPCFPGTLLIKAAAGLRGALYPFVAAHVSEGRASLSARTTAAFRDGRLVFRAKMRYVLG